jgi:hypothetical protein
LEEQPPIKWRLVSNADDADLVESERDFEENEKVEVEVVDPILTLL